MRGSGRPGGAPEVSVVESGAELYFGETNSRTGESLKLTVYIPAGIVK